jgi:hypothetical protein
VTRALAVVALLATAGSARADSRDPHRTRRITGKVIATLGALDIAIGLAHVIGSAYDNHLAGPLCPNHACNADGARLLRRSHTMALAADMLIGMGVVGTAGGVILWVGSPPRDDAPPAVGLAVVRRF